jgi:hypothetical protein
MISKLCFSVYCICHRGKTLITRYQASREPHDITSAQLLIVVWKMSTFSEEIFVGGSRTLNRYRSLISISLVSVWEVNFVLFNSMLKYVVNRLMHVFFHIRTEHYHPSTDIDPQAKALWSI